MEARSSSRLEVGDLSVHYGKAVALDGVSLSVNEGEVVTVVGPNGAGKTTLLRAISGLTSFKGKILFEGRSIAKLTPPAIVDLGLVHTPERRRLFTEMTVMENLELGAYRIRDKNLVKQTLEEVLAMFPRLRERAKQLSLTLSGGEQQMLAIARSLMSRPKLLLLDEPSVGLAPIVRKTVLSSVTKIREAKVGILLAEQDAISALSIADRAYVLEHGKIVKGGEPRDLMKDDYVKRVYLGIE